MPTFLPDRDSRLDVSTHRRRRRAGRVAMAVLLSLVAFSAAPLTAPAGATSATQTRAYDLGHAKAEFTVHFKNKRSFSMRGWLADVCPGDKRGVYSYMSKVRKERRDDGSGYDWVEAGYWGETIKDDNGCGNGRVTQPKAGYTMGDQKVRWLRITVCEEDRPSDTEAKICHSKFFTNPYVG